MDERKELASKKGFELLATPVFVGYELSGRRRYLRIFRAEGSADVRSLRKAGGSFGYIVPHWLVTECRSRRVVSQ